MLETDKQKWLVLRNSKQDEAEVSKIEKKLHLIDSSFSFTETSAMLYHKAI